MTLLISLSPSQTVCHPRPKIVLAHPWHMGCGVHTRSAQLRMPVAFFSAGEGPAERAQASLRIPDTSAQSPVSWPNLGWVLEGCQDLEIWPQFLVQRPGKSIGPWDPSKISGSGTSTDENWPSCPILPFWQSKHYPRGAVSLLGVSNAGEEGYCSADVFML